MAGPEISEGEHEVTLTEERPVVAKETVPVERVRLEKDTVTEEQNVSETVRKERIATDGVDDVYPEEPGVPQTDRNLR
jgi:stress response protein YsnF